MVYIIIIIQAGHLLLEAHAQVYYYCHHVVRLIGR
jgi:hypothetical protein